MPDRYARVTSDDEIECIEESGSGIRAISIGELEQINDVVHAIDTSRIRD